LLLLLDSGAKLGNPKHKTKRKKKNFAETACALKYSLSLSRFLEAPLYTLYMLHSFGNRVYLNIKERDRF
jgi:hypothetical protein